MKECEDAISRQAVLDGIDTYINKAQSTGTQDDFYSFAELVVKDLPPVTPQEPFMNKPCVTHQVCHEDVLVTGVVPVELLDTDVLGRYIV